MLNISDNALKAFSNPNLKKTFLFDIRFPGYRKFYSTDSLLVFNEVQNDFIKFTGSIINDISFNTSFNFKNNSPSISSINVNIIDSINLYEISKTFELNTVEAYIYFTAEDLTLNESIEIFRGIINLKSLGLENESFSLNIINNDFKYDKQFPPIKLNSSLPYVDLRNDAEKYTSEPIPIIYGYIKFPGLPIPLFYDDGNIRKYVICNHDLSSVSNFNIYADGVLVSSSNYTKLYNATNNIYIITLTNSQYLTYFQNKKITCTCRGKFASSSNPTIGQVVKDILDNYTNLEDNDIDFNHINLQSGFLSSYTVSRFFNSNDTAFNTINELSSEFPFIMITRGFKKSIVSLDVINKNYTFPLVSNKNIFDRNRNIIISSIDEVFNKFSVSYSYDALNNRWKNYSENNSQNNSLCLTSFNRIGLEKERVTQELFSVAEEDVAKNILDNLTASFSQFYFMFNYKSRHDVISVEIGDGILLTDTELEIDSKRFIVINKSLSSDFVSLLIKNVDLIE
jgi:hypothetical protein